MFILHLFEEYNEEHLDILETLDETMSLMPLIAHKLTSRFTEENKEMLNVWEVSQPLYLPAILLLDRNLHTYIYPDQYDRQEQMISTILDFFEIEWDNG